MTCRKKNLIISVAAFVWHYKDEIETKEISVNAYEKKKLVNASVNANILWDERILTGDF